VEHAKPACFHFRSDPGVVYDPLGRRQRKTVNGTSTDFVYDGLNPVREASGAVTVDLLTGLGIDQYLTRATGGSTEYFLSNALSSTMALADGSGTVATEYSYEPFGMATASGTSSSNELQYIGREDNRTGVYYYRARYYHPTLQRFISEDPIEFFGGDVNLYAYVANSPLNFDDPLGLDALSDRRGRTILRRPSLKRQGASCARLTLRCGG
jgi:RHS repeat-associated protein